MTRSDFLDSVIRRLGEESAKLVGAAAKMDEEQWNWVAADMDWNAGQICRHMVLGNEPYIPLLRGALSTAPSTSANIEVKHTVFGKMIIGGAGPSGNVAAPKVLRPESDRYPAKIVEELCSQWAEVSDLADAYRGRDINAAKEKNPFIKFVKMNVADFFEVATVHAVRHVGQIEALPGKLMYPKRLSS